MIHYDVFIWVLEKYIGIMAWTNQFFVKHYTYMGLIYTTYLHFDIFPSWNKIGTTCLLMKMCNTLPLYVNKLE